MLTDRFPRALVLAERLHRDQRRKGAAIPYVAHLLAVCAFVLEHGGDDDAAIAALLHDAAEDQGGLRTLGSIGEAFGERVAAIVRACSDSLDDEEQKPPWIERKTAYLAHLRDVDRATGLVALGDKIHNAGAMLETARDRAWIRTSGPASRARGLDRRPLYGHRLRGTGLARAGARPRAHRRAERRARRALGASRVHLDAKAWDATRAGGGDARHDDLRR